MACTGGPRATHLSLRYTSTAHAPGVTASGMGLALQAFRQPSMQAWPSIVLAAVGASFYVASKQLFFRPLLHGFLPSFMCIAHT